MKGGGYYSLATIGAKHVIDNAIPLMQRAIAGMDVAGDPTPFVVTDMGCADGGTSGDFLRATIDAVRERAPRRPIQLIYTDQPRNDFNALLRLAHGADGQADPIAARPGVHVVASATSFYRQIVPAGTLDLGFSATAMHWLSGKPCDISGHVQAVGAAGEELAAFSRRGRQDWQTILDHRAAELKPGGRLVLANFCRDAAGRYLGNTGGVSMFDTFNAIWRSFLADGTIGESEYVAMTLPQYYKTVAEFTAPLEDPANPAHRSGLRLDHAETRVTPCPFATDFRRHGDAAAFARSYIPTLRSWTESTFLGALSPGRPLDERRAIIDRYYDRYEAMVRASPGGHGMDYVHCYMIVGKVGRPH